MLFRSFNNVQDIRKYAKEHWETRASFIGQNNIWLSSKNIWKTDSPARSFAVWIKWEVIGKSKKLRGRPVFDQPLERVAEKVIKNKYKLKLPLIILNIGGIANVTSIDLKGKMCSQDIGPGNCLIDQWIRQNSVNGF